MTAHAKLGASNASRWMNCPGSVELTKDLPEQKSEYAQEGTAAHALAELALDTGLDPSNWLGQKIEGVKVSKDMVDAVRVYWSFICEIRELDDEVWLEHRVDLQKLNPPVPMFGTSDCLIYRRAEKKLFVIDYKHGAGIPVEAKGNVQGRYYALGAMLGLTKTQPVSDVEIIIVQPRAPHPDGPIRSDGITAAELIDFSADLLEAANRATTEGATLASGSHCKFCRAAGLCPELRSTALTTAQAEFAIEPPKPSSLTPAQVSDLLSKADIVEEWVRALRAHAFETLERGGSVPGFKLVPKRATRRWADEDNATQVLETAFGLEDDDIYDKKLKSPAAIQKIITKEEMKLLDSCIVSISSGYNLVPESDKRPAAALSAADEFTALP